MEYEKISIVAPEDEEKYVSGKYYYIIKNVYGLYEDEYSEELDSVKFYKEVEETSPKKVYYNEGEELKLEEIDLLKTNEINWENGKYYYISRYDFKISIGGLLGGHSGEDINKGRANANKIMGKLLLEI